MSTASWIAVIALSGLAALVALALLFVRRRRRRPRAPLAADMEERRSAIRRRLAAIVARTPARAPIASCELPSHPRAALIESKLLAGELTSALLAAEDTLLDEPSDPRVYLLLARVLVHCEEFTAAARKLVRARRLGASGPMLDYLEARVQEKRLYRSTHGRTDKGPDPERAELVTPFEEFVLELDRRRARPRKARELWLAVMARTRSSAEAELADISNLLTEHFSGYYDCLDRFMAAVEREPAFTDALYHLARLALKAGFQAEGLALMEKIEPLMYASTEKRFYDRDISRLRADSGRTHSAVYSARATKLGERRSSRAGMLD